MANRKTRPLPIAPGRPFDRPKDAFGPHLAEMPERVFQRPLLRRHLRADVQMLHLAAAAGAGVQAEMLAAGTHALGRLPAQRGEQFQTI